MTDALAIAIGRKAVIGAAVLTVCFTGACHSKDPAAAPDASTTAPAPSPNTNDLPPPAASSSSPAPAAPSDSNSSSGLVIDTSPYDGPPVSVEIVQAKRLPPISTAMIETTVPTGGWTLTLDKAEVVGETARIFLTLERPAEDAWVTQALATHKQQFTSENPPFTKAQVYIFLTQRGIQTLTANYRLAASQ